MTKGIFECKIDYDTRIEKGPEYHLAIECNAQPFEFNMGGERLELSVPPRVLRNPKELTPAYLLIRTRDEVTLTGARKLHDTLPKWKAYFRDWYQTLAYVDTQTIVIKPYDSLWKRARLPNSSLTMHDGQVTQLTPKPYHPKQWHIWPAEPVSRRIMTQIIELSSNLQAIPVHYALLGDAIESFNDEYFDLSVVYSAMALERAVYGLAMAVPRTKADFDEELDYLVERGLAAQQDKKRFSKMFVKLPEDKLTLGGLLTLLPVLPFDQSVNNLKKLTVELMTSVNVPRIDVLHYGKHANRDTAHKSVTTAMDLIYSSLPP